MTPLRGRDMPHVSWYAMRRRILLNRHRVMIAAKLHHDEYHGILCHCPRTVRG